MSQNIIIDKANIESKCWVVRSGSRYKYIQNFFDGKFIATGHLDGYELQKDLFLNEIDHSNIGAFISELNSIATRNIKTQVENFVIDMKVGDVVFTMDSQYIIPGVIKSKPYISLDSIAEDEQFKVRRSVDWGEPIPRKSIPVTLQKSFTAYQAIFSLGDNSKEIFHWLMSFFVWEDSYYGSLRIEQPKAIKHHSLKQLSELIDRIQVLSLLIGEHLDKGESGEFAVNFDVLQNAMYRFSENDELDLTVQQILMSPGDLWLKFTSKSNYAGIAFLYIVLTVSSPAAEMNFSDATYNDKFEEVSLLVDSNKDVLFEGIDFQAVKKQLILDAAQQNTEFVESAPTKNISNEFPADGDPKNIGG